MTFSCHKNFWHTPDILQHWYFVTLPTDNFWSCHLIEARTKWPPFSRHFQMHLLNENVWIVIKISLKFVPQDPLNNIPVLVQIMAWRRPGDNLSLYLKQWWPILMMYICITRPQWVNPFLNPSACSVAHDACWFLHIFKQRINWIDFIFGRWICFLVYISYDIVLAWLTPCF